MYIIDMFTVAVSGSLRPVVKRHKITSILIFVNVCVWAIALAYLNFGMISQLGSATAVFKSDFATIGSVQELDDKIESVEVLAEATKPFLLIVKCTKFALPTLSGQFHFSFFLFSELVVISESAEVLSHELSKTIEILKKLVGLGMVIDSLDSDSNYLDIKDSAGKIRKDVEDLIVLSENLNKSLVTQARLERRWSILGTIPMFIETWRNYHTQAADVSNFSLKGLVVAEKALRMSEIALTLNDKLYEIDVRRFTEADLVDIQISLHEMEDMNREISNDVGLMQNLGVPSYLDFDDELLLLQDIIDFLEISILSSIEFTSMIEHSIPMESWDDLYVDLLDREFFPYYADYVTNNRSDLTEKLDSLDGYLASMWQNSPVLGKYAMIDEMTDISSNISQVTNILREMFSLSPIVGSAGGVNGADRIYLVLAHSADELRPSGGFVSGVWIMRVNDFEISELVYYDVISVDNKSKMDGYPRPPSLLSLYMGTDSWFLRDVSWDPDFSVVAQNAQQMFSISNGVEVDGVIGINQWALLEFSKALGSISLDQQELNLQPHDLITSLEENTDSQGRLYSDMIFRSVLRRVQDMNSVEEFFLIWEAFNNSLKSRDIQIYLSDFNEREVVSGLDWYVDMEKVNGDLLYVTDSNVGWSKSDRNIERSMKYDVDVSDPSQFNAVLTLKYKNHSGYSAAECEPQWVDRGDTYSELKNACNWNLMRIYVPAETAIINRDELALPLGSIAVENLGVEPYSDTFKQITYQDKFTEFSGLIVTDVGAENQFVMSYQLPHSLLIREGNCIKYSILIKKQPGVRNRTVNFSLKVPSGSNIIEMPEEAMFFDNKVSLATIIASDLDFKVVFGDNGLVTCEN